MKLNNIKYLYLPLLAVALLSSCNNDDDFTEPPVPMATCDDGIMNGDESGVDCGGTTCEPCEVAMMEPDFTGTFAQEDFMGRPGINTVFGGNDETKNAHNVSIPSEQGASFQAGYEARLEALHDAYAVALGADPADINYEPNILGDILNGPEDDGFTNNPVTAEVLTTVLATDVLEVAPNAPTTYFNPGSGGPNYEGAIGLTGRTLQDDVIDVSLILLFGGGDGARFNGEGGLPQLVTDGVGLTADNITTTFPYIGAPE
ncbi:DUF4331 family protein [Maribacter aestuarii]|uniref:DUF4331 family protein n=1 Tax=Maribacter aestuarii TaxID=1130723 RepID=UPI00248CA712|nr:DUF4331 family protein [Maribacter aestuarii]